MNLLFRFSQTEVIFLGQLRHAHLVKLIGYCCEDEHRLLVYEYMARGSLENQLFRSMFPLFDQLSCLMLLRKSAFLLSMNLYLHFSLLIDKLRTS